MPYFMCAKIMSEIRQSNIVIECDLNLDLNEYWERTYNNIKCVSKNLKLSPVKLHLQWSLPKDFPLSVCLCAGFFCLLPRLVYMLNTLLIVVLTVIQCIFMQYTTAICISVMLTTLGKVTMTKDWNIIHPVAFVPWSSRGKAIVIPIIAIN